MRGVGVGVGVGAGEETVGCLVTVVNEREVGFFEL